MHGGEGVGWGGGVRGMHGGEGAGVEGGGSEGAAAKRLGVVMVERQGCISTLAVR